MVFKKFNTYVQYNFYMDMSWVTNSHFAKYFCDIYSECITPCTVMIYATSDAIRVTPSWLHPMLGGYGLVWLNGEYYEWVTRGNWLTLLSYLGQ
jgi:hypothetical protein